MRIKSADDKSRRLEFLNELQKSNQITTKQRTWLRDEHYRVKRGMAGEKEAAYYLDSYLKDDANRAILHDLRFVVDDQVVQIDHLIMTRGLNVFLLETKNFNGNLRINEAGEFSVTYSGEREFGIPSPLEQSRRHEGPLRKLFDALEIKGRNGSAPKFVHCVLVHPSSIIHRPDARKFDTANVIKADQFRSWHERFLEGLGVGAFVGALINVLSADTVKTFAEKLARQHRPPNGLALPDFVRPKELAQPVSSPTPSDPAPSAVQNKDPGKTRKRLVCASCGEAISFSEGKFCWNNERRFGGLQYCRKHQADFS